jgi:CspA family cold shock protein
MANGIVTRFDERQGSGFISRAGFVSREGGDAQIFVHRSQINTHVAPSEGDHVRFTLETGHDGLRAVDVSIV